jgi:hypothetical protein
MTAVTNRLCVKRLMQYVAEPAHGHRAGSKRY